MRQPIQYFKEAAEVLSCVIAALTLMSLVLSAMFPLDPLTFFFLLYAILLSWIGLQFWNNYAAMCRRAEREAYLRSEIQRSSMTFSSRHAGTFPFRSPRISPRYRLPFKGPATCIGWFSSSGWRSSIGRHCPRRMPSPFGTACRQMWSRHSPAHGGR